MRRWIVVAMFVLVCVGAAWSQSDEVARLYERIGRQQVLIEQLAAERAVLTQKLTAVLQVVQAHGDTVLVGKVEALGIQMKAR